VSAVEQELTLWSGLSRDSGIRRTLTDPESRQWQDEAFAAIEERAAGGFEFDAQDIRRDVGRAPSAGAMGAVFRRAAQAGIIQSVGVRCSSAISRHGGLVRIWRGTG
jgi:hypothetical protein